MGFGGLGFWVLGFRAWGLLGVEELRVAEMDDKSGKEERMILEHEGEDESRMRAQADANHSTSDPKPAFFGFSESLKSHFAKQLVQESHVKDPDHGPSVPLKGERRKEGWNVAPQE